MCFGPCYHVDGGLTSLSTSKDGSQVVVAGRNGETMSKDHFVNYSGTITPPPPPTPCPLTYPPCGHIIIMATLICPVAVRLLSVVGPSLDQVYHSDYRRTTIHSKKVGYGPISSLWKNNQLLPAQNLDSDSKCFSRKRNVSPDNVFYILKLTTPRRHTCLTQAVILSFTSNFVPTIAVLCKNRQP